MIEWLQLTMIEWLHKTNRIKNTIIREKVGVPPIVKKDGRICLRWFECVWRRLEEAQVIVRYVDHIEDSPIVRGRVRPRKTSSYH